jgi:hypothetical protein
VCHTQATHARDESPPASLRTGTIAVGMLLLAHPSRAPSSADPDASARRQPVVAGRNPWTPFAEEALDHRRADVVH